MSTASSAQPKQFDLPSGTMLGKYEILKKLAMGGMAEIYLARVRGTAGFEKLVVIKRILPTVADDPNFVRMFLDEARLAATLHHPNIADVYEVGEHEGAPFFAMEFVHGQDVRSIRQAAKATKERVPLAIALAIVHGAASALDYAHDRNGPDGQSLNLVHRDVSASNVLVSYEGAIKLIDFGIARATSRSHQTQVGTLKGKIPYMSPEQCRGFPLDRRSDLFSLGVVMYELTVGRRPFQGENDFAIMDQIVHQGAPPPSTLITRGYPPELEAIVLKLLARKPEERYQTAEEMLHDLDPFLQQHRLWVSPKPLSRYMRQLFANQVAAWDQALARGASIEDHLTQTVMSSQSKQSELVTPPSSFPALLPLSQEMPAVAMPTADFEKVSPDDINAPIGRRPSTPSSIAQQNSSMPPPAAEPVPDLKRGRHKVLFGLVAFLAVGGGGFVGLTVMKSVRSKPVEARAAPPQPEAPQAVIMSSSPTPAPMMAPPAPTPVVAPTTPTVATPVEQPKPAPVPKPKPHVVKPKPKPPTDNSTKPAEPPKDATERWDPNSPFLPPSK
ncbi:MAG TPA: serine/threonine-protein kinase [Kofleriaceae bacterium]|nr:serine/threonine-protein kinase [Kofleriaceae bacterium]